MEFSDDFIPALKVAFGGVNYINLSPHFLQRWEQRRKYLPEETICRIVADWIAFKPLSELDERFLIHDWQLRAKIACDQQPFRLPDDKVGILINMLTIY
jgi:hypothetical protein